MPAIRLEDARFPIDPVIQLRDRLNGPIKDATRRFANNMSAVRCNVELPIITSVLLMMYEKAAVQALWNIKGRPYQTSDEKADTTLQSKLHLEIERITDEFRQRDGERDKLLLADQERVIQNLNFILERYAGQPGSSQIMSMGAAHLFQNMIVGIWAAIEMLCNDLLRLASTNNAEDGSYQRLDSIRTAFRNVFSDKDTNIAMGDRCFDGVNLLRNIMAHKMGIVDDKFKGQCRDAAFTAWADLDSNKPFPIEAGLIKGPSHFSV